jgi:hypothetical protein
MGLTQWQAEDDTQSQTHRNRQIRIFLLATSRCPAGRRPLRKRLIAHPDGQITTLAKAFIIRRPVCDLKLLLGHFVPTVFIELMRHRTISRDQKRPPDICNPGIDATTPIGTMFDCRVESKATVGDKQGIKPSVTGWARVIGHNTILVDDRDPLAHGFQLS